MKTTGKKLAACGLALTMVLGLTACGALGSVMNMGGVSTKDVTTHIQGMMDATYLGKVNQDYLDVTEGVTEASCLEDFQANLEAEFEQNFAYIFEIDLGVSQDLQGEFLDMLKEVYSHAKYEVKEATKNSDGNFLVEVVVEPVDTFAYVLENEMDSFAEQWNSDYNDAWDALDTDSMTDDDIDAFFAEWENNWAQGVLDLCQAALPTTGNLEAQSLVIQVKYNEDSEFYELVGTDWQNLDSIILAYSY